MKKNIALFVVLLIVLLATIKTWIVFYVNEFLICAIADILIIILGKKAFQVSSFSSGATLLAIMASMLYTRGNLNAYLGAMLNISPFLLFCYLRQEVRMEFLLFFNKVFATILTISVSGWILFLLGVQMPHSYITYIEYNQFDNYFLFLNGVNVNALEAFFPRFYSIIIEPGDLACILCLLIYLDHYRLNRWYNIVYLISLMLTFSLAGLLLFVVGLIPNLLLSSGKAKLYIFSVFLSLGLLITYAITTSENSIVYQMIGQRLIEADDTENIPAYNRADKDIGDFMEKTFWKSDNVLFGYGESLPYNGVDMRVFVAKFGLVPLVAYFIFLSFCFLRKNSTFGLWYFLLFFLIFYKGYSMLFYSGMLMVYLMGIEWCYINKNHKWRLWPVKK